MNRTAFSHRKLPKPPIAWREAKHVAPRAKAANTSEDRVRAEDRVSEDFFDVEGEQAEVDIVVHRMIHEAN